LVRRPELRPAQGDAGVRHAREPGLQVAVLAEIS
jgi:hypothetical protein